MASSALVASSKNRKKGFITALEDHNLLYKEAYCFESGLSSNDGIEIAKKIVKLKQIDGIYSANDTAAISAMQYLKSKGIQIPNDIAVVGFNNDPISAVIEPGLTTVNQPDFEMGNIAATELIKQIQNKTANSEKDSIILSSELIVRNSSNK